MRYKKNTLFLLSIFIFLIVGAPKHNGSTTACCGGPVSKAITNGTCTYEVDSCGSMASGYTCTCSDGSTVAVGASGDPSAACVNANKPEQKQQKSVKCTGNTILKNGACVACPSGQTANHNTNTCEAAPPVTCTENNILQNGACVSCPSGQTANHNTNTCESAPPVTCTGNNILQNGACVPCPSGQKANHNKNICIDKGAAPDKGEEPIDVPR